MYINPLFYINRACATLLGVEWFIVRRHSIGAGVVRQEVIVVWPVS